MTLFLFYLGLSILFTHELDAVMQREWRLLFILRKLPEETAAPLFVALHIPLFGLLIWLTHHPVAVVHQSVRLALALFMVIHAGLHYRLNNHVYNSFDSLLSRVLIYGGGVTGGLYCLSVLQTTARALHFVG